jgi:2-polyprenyl-6-methoxyphenol hydroxylase-like FAD-dependent oxidoreductase
MSVQGSRVGIVGGSIAGCAAALALTHAGCDVTVFERSHGQLRDRGVGIVMPAPLRAQLASAGYLDPAMAICSASERVWMVRDGDAPLGRVLWRQPVAAVLNNWGVLWSTLRANLRDDAYRSGRAVAGLYTDGSLPKLLFEDGSRERFDLVVGADGYRSQVRAHVHPGSCPTYAGYVLWRGSPAEGRLPDRGAADALESGAVMLCFPGGHGVFYLIPGLDGRSDRGHRQLNWAIYTAAPHGLRFDDPASVPPGSGRPDLIASLDRLLVDHFPPSWTEVVRLTDTRELSIQPVYEHEVSTYVSGRVMLIGDASTITRPHTGSGATKALQDALCLEQACEADHSWSDVLTEYNRQRCAAGNDLVELGRRIGRDSVQQTPPWASMTPDDMEAWSMGTLAGRRHYLYGDVTDGDAGRPTGES